LKYATNGYQKKIFPAVLHFFVVRMKSARIPVAVPLWEGNDEFAPESKILYDKSITEHLASDIVFALAVDICTRIGVSLAL